MRILRESISLDSPDIRDVDAAVQEDEAPSVGDRLVLDGATFVVLEVGSWRERFWNVLGDRELAFALRVQRDFSAGRGVAELLPKGPSPLAAAAEAEAPPDDDE